MTGIKSFSIHLWITRIVLLFCVLEIMDALITCWAVQNGLVIEGNALVKGIAGNWGFILLKCIGAGLSGFILLKIHDYYPRLSLSAAVSISVFYAFVLVWNFKILALSLF